jgi:NAD(P)-dependent dehydrogenase (short-subunit alcohol dehydrogenase family)
MRNLQGRVAIVTGAGRGIGLSYARGLAEDGAAVAIADIDSNLAESATKLLHDEGHKVMAVTVDVSDRTSTLEMAGQVRDRLGDVQILVNNAAMYHSIRTDSQMTVDIEYWRKIFAVNLDGALLCTQAVAPAMIETGWGRVINQSSVAVYRGRGGHYGCSKAALVALTQGFARELGPHGITVNAIAPGMINTEATMTKITEEQTRFWRTESSIKKEGEPEDLVGTLRFLASDASAFMTGQTLIVDGGACARF